MESKIIPRRIFCPTHKDELVIRVSLDPDDSKLFYCIECLKDEKKGLIKFQDLLQNLSIEYINQSLEEDEKRLPRELKDFCNNQKQSQLGIANVIAKQKQRVDQELKKMEKQLLVLLKNVKKATHISLDKYEETFQSIFEDYTEKAQSRENILKNKTGFLPRDEEMHQRLFGGARNSCEVEKNLRSVLQELAIRKETKHEANANQLDLIQAKVEEAVENDFLIPNNTQHEYITRIEALQNFLEAILLGLKNDNVKKGLEQNQTPTESDRQRELTGELMNVVETLATQFEESSKLIQNLLQEKFRVESLKLECLVNKEGIQPVLNKVYRCKTCKAKHDDLTESDLICESCSAVCHNNHELEYLGRQSFICQCQFTMRECQLAVNCNFNFTGGNYTKMATYKCRECEMKQNRLFCGFCAMTCHKDHGIVYSGIQSTYCDCHSLFPFCAFNSQNS